MVLEAAILAVQMQPVSTISKLVIVCDCQSAIDVVTTGHGQARILARKAHRWFKTLRDLVELELFWIPSHGKPPAGWKPHGQASELALRKWNELADQIARGHVEHLLQGFARKAWFEARHKAKQWEVKAIMGLIHAGHIYGQHVQTLNL